jgi:hypothetical protein
MFKRGCEKEISERGVRHVFAYPFKVLRDMFTDPPFVPEPEFTSFDLSALRGEDSEGHVSRQSKLGQARRERIRIPILLLALVLVVLALIIFD